MITFEKIKIQNFMSVGNSPVEINYTANGSTIVTAANGSGKSSIMLDSITFALFGKPYRNINKPQLLNSVNQKDCLVELWFKVNKTKYRIKRGMKPGIFEIYKNDKLLNQDAASRDYQKILENGILKMNYRTFTQVVIMGSGNYVPFMRLPLGARREFIEDVLDIKIFSIMNQILKQKMADAKEAKRELELQIKSLKEKVKMQQDFIKTLETTKTEQIQEFKKKIEAILAEIEHAEKKLIILAGAEKQAMEKIEKGREDKGEYKKLLSFVDDLRSKIARLEKRKENFSALDVCPTCSQAVGEEHKDSILSAISKDIDEINSQIEEQKHDLMVGEEKMSSLTSWQEELQAIQIKIGETNTSITAANKVIKKYNEEIEHLQTNNTSVDAEKTKLKKLAREVLKKDAEKTELNEQSFYNDVASALLKDTGIKTKIIKQYLPVFNSLINKFLHELDFFVSFNLDENFNEVVKSRHRDTFTYDSFSEGEKQRLDLALLFTFREIARLKNSLHVNLLLMDETLDASLDSAGVDNFFNILDGLEKSNVFVISHREGMVEKFDHHIHLIKRGNFTEIE